MTVPTSARPLGRPLERHTACPVSRWGVHEERVLGTPRSAMTWYVCDLCGARRPRGEGLFYTNKDAA